MIVTVSRLRKAINESIMKFLSEDKDRLRRGVQDNWPGESHDKFEEDVDLETEAEPKGSRTMRLDPQHKPLKKAPELRLNPSDPLQPKQSMPHSSLTGGSEEDFEDDYETRYIKGLGHKHEDKDRLRRAADGHTERVGPSKGKFEEELELEKQGQEEKPSAGEEKMVKHLKKAQKSGSLPKVYTDPKTGKRKPTSIYAIAKSVMGKKDKKQPKKEDLAIVSSDEDISDVVAKKDENY